MLIVQGVSGLQKYGRVSRQKESGKEKLNKVTMSCMSLGGERCYGIMFCFTESEEERQVLRLQ